MSEGKELQPVKKKLTHKQRMFVEQFKSNGFNASKAARDSGYSERTSTEMGYENLRKPHIAELIENDMAAAAKKAGWSAEFIMSRLMEIAHDVNPGFALKAIEQAAKYSGMSKEEVNVTFRKHEQWLEKMIEKEIVEDE